MTWTIPQDWIKAYEEVVNHALFDNDVFSNFRRLQGYNYIIADSMPGEMAQSLYEAIKPYPQLMMALERNKVTDGVGNPKIRIPYNTSPRNLRYLWTAHLIEQNFDKVNNVVEIGVGYGGLCHVMHLLFNIEYYTLLDMPCVVKLARKWLSCFKLTSNLEEGKPPYDLTISECAITELDWPEVKQYYIDYIEKSNGFLIRSNYHTQGEYDRFVALLERDFTVEISPLWPNGSTEQVRGRILIGKKK